MKVRLVVALTGTRDGVDWPHRGEVIDLPRDEAEHMIAVGQAVPADVVESAAVAPVVETAAAATKPTRRAPRKS